MNEILNMIKTYFSEHSIFIMVIDIVILTLIMMFLLSIMRYNRKAQRKFYLIVVTFIMYLVISFIGLPITSLILADLFSYWPLLLIILFFNEVRLVVENFEIKMSRGQGEAVDSQLVKMIMSSIEVLSKDRIGALITFQRGQNLDDFITKAIVMNAELSQELIQAIFNPQAPTHDGAVIIQGNKIACAGAYYPSSDSDKIDKTLGSRHRAAIGISEIYDCLTVVVSEETGRVSITVDGYIERNVTKETLQLYLSKYLDL
ncbi:diadenylate cyclase [Mycoplasmatota bacterium WC44]